MTHTVIRRATRPSRLDPSLALIVGLMLFPTLSRLSWGIEPNRAPSRDPRPQSLPAVLGRTVPAGPGITVTAGAGHAVPAGPGTGHWRTYDVTTGLANGVVFDVLQDRRGRLWFATQGGVNRYDGRTWTTFTTKDGLPHDWVVSALEDRDGRLWFTTHGGVCRYDGQTWTAYTSAYGLPDSRVAAAAQGADGQMWFGTHGGLSRFDGASFTTFTTRDGLPVDGFGTITEDDTGPCGSPRAGTTPPSAAAWCGAMGSPG